MTAADADRVPEADNLMSIGRFSSLSQLSVRMLRHYDANGVLVPAHIDEWTGYRRYAPHQLIDALAVLKKRGALKGYYTGATAEATVIAGLGANVLVGGFKKGINLQPLSVQAQTGLNVAAGIGSLSLKAN